MTDIRDEGHWVYENHKQRMTTKEWKKILLDGGDSIIVAGRLRNLKMKNLGCGIIEVYKEKGE